MPKVIREYRVQARARIVAAAQAVFRKNGFRAATMEDIAREVGVSKGAIYLYFHSKVELLAAIQERTREQVLAYWEGLLEGGDVAEGMADSLAEVFSGKVDPGVWLELVAEAATNPAVRAAMKDDRRQDRRAMREFLTKLEQRGRIRKLTSPETVADITLAMLHGSVLDLMLHGRADSSRETLVRSLRFLLEERRPGRR
ncbi:MAG: helix-turn-helix domain-containing protein [Thermoplasmata archaeon]